MNNLLKIFIGLLLLIATILFGFYSLSWGLWDFGRPAFYVLKGGIFWLVIGISLILITLGIIELKE